MQGTTNCLQQWFADANVHEADVPTVLRVLTVERVTTIRELEREMSDPEMLEVLMVELRANITSKFSLRRIERALDTLTPQHPAKPQPLPNLPTEPAATPPRTPAPKSPSQACDAEVTPPPPPVKPTVAALAVQLPALPPSTPPPKAQQRQRAPPLSPSSDTDEHTPSPPPPPAKPAAASATSGKARRSLFEGEPAPAAVGEPNAR